MKRITFVGAYTDEQLTSLTSVYLTYCSDPEETLDELEDTLPLNLKLLASDVGSQEDFEAVQQELAPSRSKGSWYNPSKKVLEHVDAGSIPQSEKKTLAVILEPEDFRSLRKMAKRLDLSRAEAARQAIRLWVLVQDYASKGFRVQALNGTKTVLLS